MSQIEKIIGYKKEVERLRSVCDFLKNTDKYVNAGVGLPSCLLVCGQRGVGKTMMAEALATDCERDVFDIDIKTCGKSQIKRAFRDARKTANSLVLIDDIDYLDIKEDAEVFQLIDYEIDRCKSGEVFVVITADDKENLPKYLLGSIESDMIIELDPPTIEEACEIFVSIFDKYKLADDFDVTDFCCYAVDRTYSEVEEIFNMAARFAVHEGREQIAMRHLINAGLWLKDYEPADKFDAEAAYHEVGHAVVNLLLGGDAACIVLYGNCGGYFEEKNWKNDTFEDKERRYIVRVAGKACEEIFTGDIALGSKADLKRAVEDITKDMKEAATQGFEYFAPIEYNSPAYNDALAKKVQADLQRYYDKAKELITQNMPLVERFVERLREKFYLLHSEIYEIYNAYISKK